MKTKILTLLFIVVSAGVYADNSRLYSVRDRLSSTTITCIVQDHYGYIWIGTENGLNRYDGYRFTNYLSETENAQTLNDNEVTCCLQDGSRRLWVGSNEGLSRYMYDDNTFKRYKFPSNVRPRVETIVQDGDGNIFIGTSGYGYYAILQGSDSLVYLRDFSKHRADQFVWHSFVDKCRHLWCFSYMPTASRISYTGRNNGSLSPTAVKEYSLNCGTAVGMISEGGSSYLMVCMHGILRYNEKTGELTDAGFDLSALEGNVSISKVLRDSRGDMYFGTLGKGLMVIPKGSNKMVEYEASSLPFDLGTANVTDVFEDKNHNLWVGCFKKGLLHIYKRTPVYRTFSLTEQGYKLGSGVSSVAPGDAGDVWCVVQKSGVYQFGADGKVLSHQQAPDGVTRIFRNGRGSYFLATEAALYSYLPQTGSANKLLALEGRGVNSMTEGGDGTLYISDFSKGLVVYDPASNTSRRYSMYQKDAKKGFLCNDWIKSLTVDSRGLLWIGTTDGVSCMNPNDGSFKVFGWECLLEGIQCLIICEQANGDMLIGTNSGLYIFHRKQNKLEIYPNSSQLHGRPIFNLLFDKAGTLWVTTADGIWHKDKKTGEFIGGSAGEGLMRTEFTRSASFVAANGDVVFGCTDGLVAFSPDRVLRSSVPPGKVYLTGLYIGGKAVNPMQDKYSVEWDENSLTMEFSLLDFGNTEAVTFQYRLSDDTDWVSLPEGTNTMSLTRLNPGYYDMQVRAVVGGVASEDILTIKMRIKAPWYASSMAYGVYGLLAIGLLALVFYLLDRRRQRQLEEEKMRFLLNLKKDVKTALKPVNVKGNNKALLDRIMKSVNENLSNPDFNVEQLTSDVGISRAQLHRKMKEMTGVSTGDFIRNLRLDQAAALIVEGKVNVTQVAYSVGFNNQSHFSTVFRKHFGLTPSEYAVVHRKEE